MMLSATAIGPCAVLTGHRLDVRMLLRRKSREGERPCIVNADDTRQVAHLVDIVWCAEDCDALPSVLDGISRLSDFMRPDHTAYAVMLEEFPRNIRTEAQAHALERRWSQYWVDSFNLDALSCLDHVQADLAGLPTSFHSSGQACQAASFGFCRSSQCRSTTRRPSSKDRHAR